MTTYEPRLDAEGEVDVRMFNKKGIMYCGMGNRSTEEMIALLDDLDNFVAREDDVWVCAYGKSGSHWVWEIVSMLLRKTTELLQESKESAFLEMKGAKAMAVLESPRVLTTHCPMETMPADVFTKRSKVVVVMRNPKDVEVSAWYHFAKVFKNKRSFQSQVDDKFIREYFNGGWYRNVLGWYKAQKNNPDVLFIKYEDIQRDHMGHIKKIATHLNVPHDEELFQKILEKTSFQNMQKNKNDHTSFMFRKGKVGDWKNHFTVAMNEAYDADYKEKMKDTDLTFDFEI